MRDTPGYLHIFIHGFTMESQSETKSSKLDSVSLSDMHYYMIEFDEPKFMLSQVPQPEKKGTHLTESQLGHAFEAVVSKISNDEDVKALLIHMMKNNVIKTVLDKKRDMMLGPNVLRATFVFPNKAMLPSQKPMKVGMHSLSMVGKRFAVDKIEMIIMLKLNINLRELSEMDAIKVFEGFPHMCVAGML
ncbi:matrix protein [Persimmon virus A]|uniref:Matrix protein n=1 Tax=Persimmon virus A TaxID=1211480 RepID=R4WAR4_9RHAB|nr:matrix protein [Persimmon virus A]BAM36033.1 matrix protein [Persimmon virus A]